MRYLFLLRGCPASGKSTWIKNNNLESYTLSADGIRLMYQSPILDIDGNLGISQNNDGEVWDLLFKLLENRMSKGEMVVVDATNYKSELLNRYKPLFVKYRYRPIIVDFTDVPIDELYKRNNNRESYKRVPTEVIDKMYAVFTSDNEVNTKFKIVKPDEAVQMINNFEPISYDKYEKVVVFGDIHGCYEPLKEYFDNNPLNDNYAYVFTGDYIDRGIQNKQVLEFLLSIYDKKNVLLLEGNHENYLRMYANNEHQNVIPNDDLDVLKCYLGQKEVKKMLKKRKIPASFLNNTRKEIADIKEADLRQLCRAFGQMAYFTFGDKTYFICHGGIPVLPNIKISTKEMIRGVGKYEDILKVYEAWIKNTSDNNVLIHAHRNIFNIPIKPDGYNDRVFNLCDEVEFGSNFRVLEINKDNTTKEILIKNNVYNTELKKEFYHTANGSFNEGNTNEDIIRQLETSRYIKINKFDNNICSYNFTTRAFEKGKWNESTCTARGLFVDKNNSQVIMRSYDKFFNWG